LHVPEQRRDVLADVMIPCARTELLGVILIVSQRTGGQGGAVVLLEIFSLHASV
jgi:hypothetical protein